VEAFVTGQMYHIDGFFYDGEVLPMLSVFDSDIFGVAFFLNYRFC
jgi:hypothetical protein